MKKTNFMIAAMALLVSSAAHANVAIIDYQGYAWETGGLPLSNPGDVLSVVGVVDALDASFGVNLLIDEVTVYASGLVSTGQIDLGGGVLSVSYTGGTLELWRDPSRDHDYGVSPPNTTAPPTFVNGGLFLGGTFQNFFLFLDTSTGTGAFQGDVAFTAGSGIAALSALQPNGFTFGGTLNSAASGGNVPAGYDMQVDGTLQVEIVTGVEDKSWGAVKEMYRR